MIGSLRGVLEEVVPGGDATAAVVVDVGGVGYLLSVATRTAAELGPAGGEVRLAVHTHVRDTAITLYGFADGTERRCFEVLIATHGIGPALALAILSVHRPDELARIVLTGDEAALTAVPGVGRKTAARLLVELENRVDELAAAPSPLGGAGAGLAAAAPTPAERVAAAEVADALAALGYGPDEVRPVLRSLPAGEAPEVLLRDALRQLAGRR